MPEDKKFIKSFAATHPGDLKTIKSFILLHHDDYGQGDLICKS
jgi:hypothetical protein